MAEEVKNMRYPSPLALILSVVFTMSSSLLSKEVALGISGTQPHIASSKEGSIHIVYNQNGIRYAKVKPDGSKEIDEAIPGTNGLRGPWMCITPDNVLHVSATSDDKLFTLTKNQAKNGSRPFNSL